MASRERFGVIGKPLRRVDAVGKVTGELRYADDLAMPGMLLAAKSLLERNAEPSRAQIAEALSGQICRCTGYLQIFDAVAAAARMMRGEPAPPPQLPRVHRGDGDGREE